MSHKCSIGNCVHKPFGTLPKRSDRRKKNEEEEEEKNEEEEEKNEEEEEEKNEEEEVDDDDNVDDDDDDDDEEDDDDVKKRKPATKIRWCECGKQITSQIRFHPEIKGDDRSGKPCCEGCYRKAHAKKMNEKCVVCKKKITSRFWRHPTIKGDDGRGKPCCEVCHDKAIEKKNLELGNICENCEAEGRGERGGRYAKKCETFLDEFWRCRQCHRGVQSRRYNDAKRAREGKPAPKVYKRRKF